MAYGGRDLKDYWLPTPCHGPPAQVAQGPSSLALSTSRDGAPQLSGQLCQGLIALLNKDFFFLTSDLHFLSFSLKPFLLLSLSDSVKPQFPSCLRAPFKYQKATVGSPQSLLFFKKQQPSPSNLPWPGSLFSSLKLFIIFLSPNQHFQKDSFNVNDVGYKPFKITYSDSNNVLMEKHEAENGSWMCVWYLGCWATCSLVHLA